MDEIRQYEKVNKYYDNWYLYPDDYTDLKDEEIYFDKENQQYKVKFYCGECNGEIGWFCYSKYDMNWLLHELEEGMLCEDCGNAINPYELGSCIGHICRGK